MYYFILCSSSKIYHPGAITQSTCQRWICRDRVQFLSTEWRGASSVVAALPARISRWHGLSYDTFTAEQQQPVRELRIFKIYIL
jgi:hypothetical protein